MPDEARDDKLFEFYDVQKLLVVHLKRPALEEVVKLIQSKSELSGLADVRPSQISHIELYDDISYVKEFDRPKGKDIRVAVAIGCIVVGFAAAVVFGMGLASIFRLIWP